MNILKTRKIWFGFSALLVVASIVAMSVFGFRIGIDFAGGTLLEIRTNEINQEALPVNTTVDAFIVSTYKEATGQDTTAQRSGEDGRFLLRSKAITNEQKNDWLELVSATLPNLEELQFESISPTIGAEVVRKAVLAVILAVIAILLYVAYSFRRVPRPTSSWQFGSAAIVALVHDVIILLGAYAILSRFWGAEVDGMFIVALLTLLGFSVHDTIVTFDRLRENLIRRGGANLEQTINNSVVETITRSINTSFTLILVLLAMVLMGGSSITFFTLALLIGVVMGTYSSIFIAAPLLLMWHQRSTRATQ
jgi:preprotein translocase subunit SecF